MLFKTTDDGEKIISFFNKAKIESENFAKQLEKDKIFLTEYFNSTGDVAKQQAILNKSTNEASKSAIEYAVSTKGAAGSVSNFEQQQIKANASIQKSKKYFDLSTVSAGAYKLAIKGITIVANMATSVLLSGVVYAFSKLFTAQNEAIEKAKELTSTYKSNNTSLEDYKEQINTLVTELNTSNISYEDSKTKRKELMSIQDELFKKYGTEEEVIKSITAAINGEVDALDTLSQKSYYEWLASVDSLTGDKKFGNGFFKIFTGISDQYKSALDSAVDYMEDKTQFFYVKATGNEELDNLIQEKYGLYKNAFNEFVIKDMVPEEAYELLSQIRTVYRDNASKYLGDETDNILAATNDSIQSAMTTIDAELVKHKETYHTYLDGMIKYDSEYSDEYADLISKRASLEEAELSTSTNDEGKQQRILEAKKAFYDSLNNAITSAENNDNAKRYFENLYPDLYSEISSWNFEYSISANTDGIADTAKEIGEKYTATDLLGMTDDESAIIADTAFNSLIDKAIEYGICTDKSAEEVQKLIDLLVELGIVQDNVRGDSFEPEIESLSKKLTDSTDSLDKFQSSVKSAADAYTKLLSGNYSSTDLLDSIQAINKAASEMGKSIDWEEIGSLDELRDKIEEISKTYADSILSGTGLEGSKFGQMLANIIQESYKSETALSNLNKQIDTLQNAYNSLTDIVSTYNETGYITFDQLQTFLAMEPQYLSCLMDENGQLKLNQESMLALANQRLNDAKAQAVQQAITELGQLVLQDEKTAVEENAQAFNNAVNDLAIYNEELAGTIGETSIASSVIRDLNDAINGAESQGATDIQIDTVLDNLNTKLQLIRNTRLNLDKSLSGIVSGKSSSSSSSSSTDNYKEQFGFFQRRIEVLNDAVNLLKTNLENVNGSFAKNQLLDQSSSILEERMRNYSDALKMYQQKAQESLSKLDLETQRKIIDGSVNITDYIGEGNKAVVEAMNGYKAWSDKVADCTQELASLKEELRQLELDKFNHIIQDFTDQFDLRDNAKSLINKQTDLFKEAGELIGESFYTTQIDQSQKQLELLENEKAQLVNQLNNALNSGRIQKGTKEWLEMVKALSDVDGNILDCKKSIETFDNAIQNLHWETFDRVQDTFGNLSDEISNLLGAMKDTEVATPDNQWTAEGLTQLGLYAQQYELATYQASQYANEIDRLNADYLKGKYSATEYADKLADLSSAQWKAVNAAESAKDSILDLNETRVGVVSDGIQKEIDAYKELIDSQTEALDTEKELREYQNSIAEKSGNIAKMEKQLAAMQNDTTAAAVAKRKQLEEQLAQTRADLEETQYQHSVETQKESLNQQYEDYENARNQEIESLEESLKDKETIIAVSMESVKQNTQIITSQITEIANQHGIKVSTALTNSWASGENAIASYGEVLSQQTSAFIGNIMAVESQIYQLQADADITALSLANMFGVTADNLVNQLNASYFAETNLLNMTNALQNSLINTLQGGYNATNIVNALNSITDAARKAKDGINSLNEDPNEHNPKTEPKKYEVYTYNTGKVLETLDHSPSIEEIEKICSKYIGYNAISKVRVREVAYASGTRNARGGLRVVNEDGFELVLPKLSSGNYTVGNAGDQILTKPETDNIFEWAKIDPHNLIPINMTEHINHLRAMSMPQVLPNNIVNSSPVTMNYDHLIEINGDVNDTNHFIKQISTVAEQAITNAVKTAEKTRKYGMF